MRRFLTIIVIIGVLLSMGGVEGRAQDPVDTPTFTPTQTLTPTPDGADAYEPNDVADQATLVGVGETVRLTLHYGDVDWIVFWLKPGRTYHITADVRPGGDTLLRVHSQSLALLAESDDRGPGDPSSEVVLTPGQESFYYAQVSSKVVGLFADYDFRVTEAMPTATPTLTPTATPTPTGTPTATPNLGDAYEPNDEFSTATSMLVGETVRASIHSGDLDFFQLYVKEGVTYRCDVTPMQGLDSELVTYNASKAETGRNDDRGPGDPGSALTWLADATGWVYLRVGAVVGTGEYTLLCTALSPTATPTARPTGTSQPTPTPNDPYEPNYNFDTAADIVPGTSVAAFIDVDDNDFYRLYIKAGNRYRCEVTPQGFDPNLIVYDQSRNGIGGNDDRSAGELASSFTWYANYAGWAYLLVGPVGGTGPYTLLCSVVLPTATPTWEPYPTQPASAPQTIPTATNTGMGGTGAEPGTGADPGTPGAQGGTPTPTPTLTPTPPVFDVTVLVYYDDNNNKAPEPTEGIQRASLILLDPVTNKPLTQVFTDDTGSARVTYVGLAEARVAVPFLGYSKVVKTGEHVMIQIKPQLLPGLLP